MHHKAQTEYILPNTGREENSYLGALLNPCSFPTQCARVTTHPAARSRDGASQVPFLFYQPPIRFRRCEKAQSVCVCEEWAGAGQLVMYETYRPTGMGGADSRQNSKEIESRGAVAGNQLPSLDRGARTRGNLGLLDVAAHAHWAR